MLGIAAVPLSTYCTLMGLAKYLAAIMVVATLTACSGSSANPIHTATKCVRQQVPEGHSVSVARAQSVLRSCQAALDAWSRYSVEGMWHKPFNSDDAAMLAAFRKHQVATRGYWMASISAEYAASHPRYD